MKKAIFTVLLLLVSVITLSISRAVLLNHFSSSGSDLSAINTQIEDFKRENALLNEQILDKNSLTILYEDAEDNGYEDLNKNNIVNISNSVPVAINR